MRFINTKTHGILDYLMGVVLIISPWLFGFANGGAAQMVPIVIGIVIIGMSIFTHYELGLVKKIPMSMHLTLDVIGGIVLAISPWLFGFSEYVFLPHLIFGLLEVGAGLTTEKSPEYDTMAHG